MKTYKVVKSYNDRFTGETHLADTEVELTDERAKELKSAGYVEELNKTTKSK